MRLGVRFLFLVAVAVAACGASCTWVADFPEPRQRDGADVPFEADGSVPDADGDGDADADADTEADVDTEVDADADADADAGDDSVGVDRSEADADADGSDAPTDSDGDTIPDEVEGWTDVDGDTLPNAEDPDSDGDGISDAIEAGDADPGTDPLDSDRDGVPDFLDMDSDDDSIADDEEWVADPDDDGMPAYRDWDSDGDGIPDAVEAGDDILDTPPKDSDGDTTPDFLDGDSDDDLISDADETVADTDGDTTPDYLDADSDDDGLPDIDEAGDAELGTPPARCDDDALEDFRDTDSDNDGIADGDETLLGTDRCLADSDGDTVTDLIEVSYGSDPLLGTDFPEMHGDLVMVVPFLDDPEPWRSTLVFSAALRKADVYFLVGSTGSMSGEIANLRMSMRTTVIPGFLAVIPDVWTGVGQFDDYPVSPYGSGADNSYSNLRNLTSDPMAAQDAVDRLPNHAGDDEPDSQVVALFTVASSDPSRTLPGQPTRSCPVGYLGYPCFRPDAVRVIVLITDSSFHNGPGDSNPYTPTVGGVTPPTYREARDQLVAQNIKVIGINSGLARPDLEQVARATAAVYGGSPMVFDISSSGTGLGDQVVDAISMLANGVPIRVDAQFVDDPVDAVDTLTVFLDFVETNTSGATIHDPETGTDRVCTAGLTGDSDGDGRPDYFTSLLPGTSICWDIGVKRNEIVPATDEPQIYRATINVIGDLFTPLDSRDVYFLVPPVIAGSR